MPNEADIRVYADGFRRRYGLLAAPSAREHAEKLRNCGDSEGHRVWLRVADAIANSAPSHHTA